VCQLNAAERRLRTVGTLAAVGPDGADGVDGGGPDRDDGVGDDFDEAVRRMLDIGSLPDAPHEPSHAERQRAARQADLIRRLDEQAQHEAHLAERDGQLEHVQTRRHRRSRWLAPIVVIALVATGIVLASGRGEELVQGTPELRRPADWPPADTTASEVPLGSPPALPAATGPYELLNQHEDGSPVTWDPCRPIRYVVNPTGAPPGGEAFIDEALARTSGATGLQFQYDGTTDETWDKQRETYQPDRYGERWAPVLFSWSTEQQTPPLGGYVAGLGGPSSVGLEEDATSYVSGSVVLDAADLGLLLGAPNGAASVQAVVQHEVGHLVGLDHVADETQIMNTEGSPTSATDWGPGDLAGLHELGTGECRPEI